MHPQTRFPVEVIARILSYTLASPADDPQKLPLARPHSVSVLLVCKGITRLLLPRFYRSVHVLKPMDWYTLFNSEYGVLGLDERATPEDERRFPRLAIRSSWVHELFLGITAESQVVSLPLDVQTGSTAPVDWDYALKYEYDLVLETFASWLSQHRLLPDDCKPDLPNLDTLVLLPLPRPGPRPEVQPVLDNYERQLRARMAVSATDAPHTTADISDISDMTAWLGGYMLSTLGVFPQIPAIHLPVDHTFLAEGWLTPYKAVYMVASKAELFAYLDLDGLSGSPMHFGLGDVRTAFDVLMSLLRAHEDWSEDGTPANNNVVLVGKADDVAFVIGEEHEDLVRSFKGWQWLAPDGRRRDPANALGFEEQEAEEVWKSFVEEFGFYGEEAAVHE